MRFPFSMHVLVLPVLMLLTSAPTNAETSYRERSEYFDISGKVRSRRAMWDAIRDWGPSGAGERLIVGQARPRFGYSYKFSRRGGICRIQDLKVTVGVVLRLPQWIDQDRAKPELQRYFGCVLRTVTVHEKRHGQIAFETGEKIEAAMMRQLDGTSCDGIKYRAKAIFDRVIKVGNKRQSDFDRRDYARRRYQQCNNSDGPEVSLNGSPVRRKSSYRPAPTKRFNVADTSSEVPPRRTVQRSVEPRKQRSPATEPEFTLDTTYKLLGGAGVLLAVVASGFGVFAMVMLGATKYERRREAEAFAFDDGSHDDQADAMSEPTRSHATQVAGNRSSQRSVRKGFGKRSRS
ncbi:MAG: DUF922 domain-containing protein [Hyphomicrobiaceae bacterium]